jgi:hypothetical protein
MTNENREFLESWSHRTVIGADRLRGWDSQFREAGAKAPKKQRRESRLAANTPVKVTLLKILGEPVFSGHVIDMSGSGLRVSIPSPIPCGSQVKVEAQEMLIFSEVCRCDENDGSYSVGLMVSELRPLTV